MSDQTKVYTGGIPTGGFDAMQGNSGLSTTSEAETSSIPGKTDAPSPKTVNEGGTTQAKTHNKQASEDFLLSSDYKTNMEVAGRPTSGKTVNPNDLSHADSC